VTAFVGLDLAWTAHRETGICVFDTDWRVRLLEARVASPSDFAGLACSFGPDVVVAVDAPLIVTSLRSVERSVSQAFGRFHASAHQANLELLLKTNRMAGPHLYEQLFGRGFSCEPSTLRARAAGRHAMEVYPHAAHVSLFNLAQRLPYKRKKGRHVAFIREQLRLYQDYLRSLLRHDVPGVLADATMHALLEPQSVECRGQDLKRLEDVLDAVTCAYVAWYAWEYGSAGIEVFGDEHGHIVVPLRREITSALARTSPSARVSGQGKPSLPAPAEAGPA